MGKIKLKSRTLRDNEWEIIPDDIPMAQEGLKVPKKIIYTDKDKYEKAKKRYDDSSAYNEYYKLQKNNELLNKPSFSENFLQLSNTLIGKPINYLSGLIAPEQKKKEEQRWKDYSVKSFDFFRELDINRAKGDVEGAKKTIHKYSYDDQPQRKKFWEENFTKPYKEERQQNIKELWETNSIDKSPYKNFEDFKNKQETLWNYGDSLIAVNPDFRWSNSGNSPDLTHRNIEPTGQWRGLAYNNSLMSPPSTEPILLKNQVMVDSPSNPPANGIGFKRQISQIPKPKEKITPPDTLKVPQYTKIVDGKRIPITQEEYNKRTKGQEAKPTGYKLDSQGKVLQFKQEGGSIKTDPQGYWNKENHGKPVRIPSNQITMQGVNQPLYGIDDTGFAQMMYPEQDYTFPGNSVTEFPIMQDGGIINPNLEKILMYQDSLADYDFYQKELSSVKNKPGYEYLPLEKGMLNFRNSNTNHTISIPEREKPVKPLDFFTRDRLKGEEGSKQFEREGKKDYFNATGKLLGTYKSGGNVNTLEGDLYSKVLMNRNKNLDFVQRAFAVGENPNSPMFNQWDDFDTKATHKMGWGTDDEGAAWMFPTIMNPNNEAIPVPNQYAEYISNTGYKKATRMQKKLGGKINSSDWEIIQD